MIYEKIIHKTLIEKGWSADKKYHAITGAGEEFLLRISPSEQTDRVQQQFLHMQRAEKLGIPMCVPLEWGISPDGPYLIQSWIHGTDAEAALTGYTQSQQYAYGYEAGRILRKLHSLPAPVAGRSWADYFNRKIDRKLASYAQCPLKYAQGEILVQYIHSHRHLLTDRPEVFHHGDFHCGNLMIDNRGELMVIDFDKWDQGDPWEEFNRIVWCAQLSPAFASGRIDGYFEGTVPMEFWELLALYVCNNCIGSLPWAIPFGDQEIKVMRHQAAQILQWYDNFRNVIPNWYRNPDREVSP